MVGPSEGSRDTSSYSVRYSIYHEFFAFIITLKVLREEKKKTNLDVVFKHVNRA
jgi:hypothetical protein